MQMIKAFKVIGPATCGRVGRTDYGRQEVTKDISVFYHYGPSSLGFSNKFRNSYYETQVPHSFLILCDSMAVSRLNFYSPWEVVDFELPGPKFYG